MKAQAILDLMLIRKDKYKPEQIEAQRKIVADLNNYGLTPTANKVSLQESANYWIASHGKPAPATTPQQSESLSPAVQQLLAQLRAERDAIDKQKNALANKMTLVPDGVNCKDLVQQIKKLREAWIAKGDEILYVTRHGALPSAPDSTEIVVELPEDKLQLNRLLLNTRANLSKYRKRLALAKTDAQKQLQGMNIKKAEVYIRNIEFKLNTL